MPTPVRIFLTGALAAALAACGGGTDTPASTADETETGAGAQPEEHATTERGALERGALESGTIAMPRSPSPDGARVFFITPADGDTVTSPVSIEFGIEGMTVVPAGEATEHSGHHHLIVNADLPPLGMPIPASESYIHFGDGSTSTSLELPLGQHTLQLLLGDHLHIPHDPPVSSEVITISVVNTLD